MLDILVNPNELTEVVYLREVKDEDFLRRMLEDLPGKIAEGLRGNAAAPQVSESSKPHYRLAWWQTVLGIVVSIFVILGGLWAGLHFVISAELRTAFEQPNKDLASLRDKDVGGLRSDIGHVQENVTRLLDWQARMAFTPQPGKSGATRIPPEELKEVAKYARERKIATDVASIELAAQPLEQSKDKASWEALLELANLRSFANSSLAQANYNIIQVMHANEPPPGPLMRSGPNRWIVYEGEGTSLLLDKQGKEPGKYIIDNGEPAGLYENFIFRNTRIVYHGNPIVLVNVFFDNCTFEINDNANGRSFAGQILRSMYPSFKPIPA
jgi:hypothetical protein